MKFDVVMHEMNNHLSVISGYSELLLDSEVDESKRVKLERVMRSCKKMEACILCVTRSRRYGRVREIEFGKK
jgi:hypothetical protein